MERRELSAYDEAGAERGNRHKITKTLSSYDADARAADAGVYFQWNEFNAAQAFLRDEGPRYDPAAARICYGMILELFTRTWTTTSSCRSIQAFLSSHALRFLQSTP